MKQSIVYLVLLLWLVQCQNDTINDTVKEDVNISSAGTYLGFLSIRDKLLADITNTEIDVVVGYMEMFKITVASVTPYRWIVDTPRKRPFIKCRQNIIDKEGSSSSAEEVTQIFQCRSKYRGNGRLTLKLESIDPRVTEVTGLEAKVNIQFKAKKVGDKLTQFVPSTVPTFPLPEGIPEEVISSNPYNKWRPKPKPQEKTEEHVYEDYYQDYFDDMGYPDYDQFDFNDYSDYDFDYGY